jgi:hypothetical protein
MHKQPLTPEDYARAAAELGVPVAYIKGVVRIEAPNGGFQSDGQPTILFERHKFSRATGGVYDQSHPGISNPQRGGYGTSSSQHGRLQRAAALNRSAALKSASWGAFQILGENYRQAGHKTLQSFINAMYAGERGHLDAFVAFVKADPRLLKAMRAANWHVFAEIFNGPGQDSPAGTAQDYDTRIAAAVAQEQKQLA